MISTQPGVGDLARRVAALGDQHPELAARAARLAERVAAEQFHVAVLGDFKRGKSTLVNALVGRSVLPSGVVPLTTVATEVHFSSPGPRTEVVFSDGHREAVDDIAAYVTEAANPANRLGVRRVEVGVPTTLGAPGLVLVDTPGMASVNEHQTVTAHRALADSDGAVVVLSADSPLSESEQALLTELRGRGATVFVVVNKCDHLHPGELEEVRAFLGPHLHRLVGDVDPFFVAARPALDGVVDEGFLAFREALERFVRDELRAARRAAAERELARLGAALSSSVAVERAAAALDAETLRQRLALFEEAAREGRRLFDDDCTVLRREVAQLQATIGGLLAEGTTLAARACWAEVAASMEGTRPRQLGGALDGAVAEAVRRRFEPLRQSVADRAEGEWTALAGRFEGRMLARVESLRTAAGNLFGLHLPGVPVPAVHEQRERFTYHFLRVESPGTSLGRLARRVLPTAGARRRLLAEARRRLEDELDKHAGRARYDLCERVEEAARRFVASMGAELDETETSILAAAARAAGELALGQHQQAERERARREAAAVAEVLAARSAALP